MITSVFTTIKGTARAHARQVAEREARRQKRLQRTRTAKRHNHVSTEFGIMRHERERERQRANTLLTEHIARPPDRPGNSPSQQTLPARTRRRHTMDSKKHNTKRTPHDQSHSFEQVDHLPLDAVV